MTDLAELADDDEATDPLAGLTEGEKTVINSALHLIDNLITDEALVTEIIGGVLCIIEDYISEHPRH